MLALLPWGAGKQARLFGTQSAVFAMHRIVSEAEVSPMAGEVTEGQAPRTSSSPFFDSRPCVGWPSVGDTRLGQTHTGFTESTTPSPWRGLVK